MSSHQESATTAATLGMGITGQSELLEHTRHWSESTVPPLAMSLSRVEGQLSDLTRRSKSPANTALIMMIDDEPITLEVLQAFLEEVGYSNFITSDNSSLAYQLISVERPDVVLLDLMMPKVSGFDILARIRRDPELQHTPVIVLTSSTDAETKLRVLELGATDFLAKPVDQSELELRLRNTLAAKAYQDQLVHFDLVTGLPNRKLLTNRLQWALDRAWEFNSVGAVIYIDLEGFKKINDVTGPSVGDRLLRDVADRFKDCLRGPQVAGAFADPLAQPMLARFGGDEFVVLLQEAGQGELCAKIAQWLIASLATPFQIGEQSVFVAANIGMVLFPNDANDVDTLIKNAGAAVTAAKAAGSGQCQFFSEEMNQRSLRRLTLESELRHALEKGEFKLLYQPKVAVASGEIVGAEALVRWQHPRRGLLAPGAFIVAAEETGLIVTLGAWVLRQACAQLKVWQATQANRVKIAVNVSAIQFADENFFDTVHETAQEFGVPPSLITLELTESVLMRNADLSIGTLLDLKARGFGISIDDFGTGYSSLSYLSKLPVDEVKIDRAFLAGIEHATDNAMIVLAIIAMSHGMGRRVVAEGVETEAQLEYIRANQCDEYQGYFFSKPISAPDFAKLLFEKSRAPCAVDDQ